MTRSTYSSLSAEEGWLRAYYFARALFSVIWVILAFTAGVKSVSVAGFLFVIYPAWDAVANYVDASRSGGLGVNRTQAINVVVSVATTLAVVFSLPKGMNAVFVVFGAWAILSGLLQLATAIRRWKGHGAQWAMVLSGAQSALAGGFFIAQAQMPTPPSIANLAGYAAVGAVYFLISGIALTVKERRRAAGRVS